MTAEKIKNIDTLFQSYNYTLSDKSNNNVRIYTLRYGMYHAAEIILFDKNYDVSNYKKEYSELGYATDVKVLENEDSIEEYLFEGFFIKTPLGNELKNRYKHFVNRQLQNLPEGSEYKYINSSFDLIFQDSNGDILENASFDFSSDYTLINKINHYLSQTKGAIFIIIEAPAGFGKTCTANEILNTFSPNECKKLPFFTELSRNREARVFKHILLNEIDDQFPNGIKQNIVLEQIYKGRIPLIIDGFDELISKESNKDEVESMLTTIIELLKGDAKIIITSRKTAIFNSDEFLNTVYDSKNKFSLARFEIKEPTIENWLERDKIDIISNASFPIEQIANPVLLSYLRNIPIEKLVEYVKDSNDGALIDKYIDYLLKREQQRQNLKLNSSTQLRIFRKLIRFMTEFNITGETKETIKELIKEYNLKILQDSLKEYIAEERPTIDDLVDTLSNHVFLDRKSNGNVGFVNDFIFGNLIGENLITGKYKEHYKEITSLIPQDFAIKSIQSFKIQSSNNKKLLWSIYNDNLFPFGFEFYFDLDYTLTKQLNRDYSNLFLSDRSISHISFSKNKFAECIFSSISFYACEFNPLIFKNTSFQNCKFYDCTLLTNSKIEFMNFGIYACTANNSFVNSVEGMYNVEIEKNEKQPLTEIEVLKHFFHIGGIKPRARKFSYIKKSLNDSYSDREISKVIEALKTKQYLHFKDDVGFITREAINYLKHI